MRTKRRRQAELAAVILAGGLIPGWGPLFGQMHAERWQRKMASRR